MYLKNKNIIECKIYKLKLNDVNITAKLLKYKLLINFYMVIFDLNCF